MTDQQCQWPEVSNPERNARLRQVRPRRGRRMPSSDRVGRAWYRNEGCDPAWRDLFGIGSDRGWHRREAEALGDVRGCREASPARSLAAQPWYLLPQRPPSSASEWTPRPPRRRCPTEGLNARAQEGSGGGSAGTAATEGPPKWRRVFRGGSLSRFGFGGEQGLWTQLIIGVCCWSTGPCVWTRKSESVPSVKAEDVCEGASDPKI